MSAFFFSAGSTTGTRTGVGATTGAGTGAGATTGAGAAAAEVITAVLFDAAGLSTFFFLEPDARAEDGEERLPSPSLLRFLDKKEEAAGILIKLLGNELLRLFYKKKLVKCNCQAVTGQKKKLSQILAWLSSSLPV